MIIKTTLEKRGPISPEEIELLEKANKVPIVFDEDSPELTEEEMKGFRRVSRGTRPERNGLAVALGSEIPQKVS